MLQHLAQFLRESARRDVSEDGYVTFTMGEEGEGSVASFEVADVLAAAELLENSGR